MKKLIVIFVLAFVAFVSCKQFDFGESQEDGEYGTVVFDLTNRLNARAAGEGELPDINGSRMNITIAVDGQREETIPFSKDARKQYKGVFLVGTKVRFGVVLLTKSGKWKGSSEITVASGTDNLSVRLKKAVAELEPLKFRLKEEKDIHGPSTIRFELGFLGEETPFFNETVSGDYKNKAPSFCRDSKGRTYIFYVDSDSVGSANKILRRYTSEGILDTSFTYVKYAGQIQGLFVVSDYKTGKVFASYVQGSNDRVFYLVEEGDPYKGTSTELKSITLDPPYSISDMKLMGVYDGVFAFVDNVSAEYKIKLYRYEEEGSAISLKAIGEKSLVNDFLKVDIKAANEGSLIGEFVDCFMNDKSVYLLYKYEKNQSSFGISTGGIAKCDYAVQDETVSIKDVERLIGDTKYVADARNIVSLEDEKREFYGPQRFVGFDEDGLYVADDGVTYAYDTGAFQIKEHKNRLAYFDLRKESLSIKGEHSNLDTWMVEARAISKINATLFFSHVKEGTKDVIKCKVYDGKQLVKFGTEDVLTVEENGALGYVFDSFGSLYVHIKDTSSPGNDKIEKYVPYKTENGIVYEKTNVGVGGLGLSSDVAFDMFYYDNVKKDLYCTTHDSRPPSRYILYKLNDNNWDEIDNGGYSFKSYMTIYDGKIWAYDKGNGGKIESIRINEKEKKLDDDTYTSFAAPPELNPTVDVKCLSACKNNLYFFYLGEQKKEVRALALGMDGQNPKKETLFRIERDSKVNNLGIKPIGIDEEKGELRVLYDGTEKDYDGRAIANANKYISLKYDGGNLSKEVHNLPSGANDIIWYEEMPLWKGTKDVALWENMGRGRAGIKLYVVAVENVANDLLSATVLSSGGSFIVYDNFCYDQFGNLYVVIGKDNKYYIVRFKLNDEGKYDFSEFMGKIGTPDFNSYDGKLGIIDSPAVDFGGFIMAVYADSAESGVIYYRDMNHPGSNVLHIKQHKFENDNFAGNESDPNNSIDWVDNELNSDKIERQFIAMAANKDGVFVAQKELEYVKGFDDSKIYKDYNIEVRKYPHNEPNYEDPLSRVDIVGKPSKRVPTGNLKKYDSSIDSSGENVNWDTNINETITDMYTYNGSLYALSYKRIGGGNDVFILGQAKYTKAEVSGAMWKVLDDTKGTKNIATKIYEKSSADKKTESAFSPRHFIGVLPEKLVVDCDYYYAWTGKSPNNEDKVYVKNYDKVFFLNLKDGNVTLDSEQKVKAHFYFNYNEEQGNSPISSWN